MQVWGQRIKLAVAAVHVFFNRHWKRLLPIRERFRFTEEAFHLLLAGLVGIIGGLVNLSFYFSLNFLTGFMAEESGDLVQIAQMLPPIYRLVIPTLGGLAAGLVLYHGLRLAGPQGATNILEVVVAGDGRLRMRSALVKAFSSLLSIGSGASIGREGSITQLTAALSSKLGQVFHWQPYRLRVLVACGAASGMAAAYNAPVAAAVFAAQIVLGNFSMNLFAPLVFASVIATMVSRSFFGLDPIYQVQGYDFGHWLQLPWFIVLGIFSGMVGALFMKLIRISEKAFVWTRFPIYARLTLGGFLVGLLAIRFPEVWGNGYGATNRILDEQLTIGFVCALFLAKLAATVITVGSGAVGGVFTPTLFLGAGLGSIFGLALHGAEWTSTPISTFALIGMGSVLAATIHAPLLAMILIFEISLNYSLMPPLMLACVISTITARSLHPASVYTEPLRRKGVQLERENQQIGAAFQQTVAEIMRDRVAPLRETSTFREITDRFLSSAHNFLPVVDIEQRLLGVVALQDLKEYLNAGAELNYLIAYDIMRPPPPCLMPSQRLIDVLPVLLASEQLHVPVVNNMREYKLVGAVVRSEALGLVSEAISVRSTG